MTGATRFRFAAIQDSAARAADVPGVVVTAVRSGWPAANRDASVRQVLKPVKSMDSVPASTLRISRSTASHARSVAQWATPKWLGSIN
jgi:hypothetical protein